MCRSSFYHQTLFFVTLLFVFHLYFPIVMGGEISFQLEKHVIFVKGFINGRGPYTLILDTGATKTVVTPPTARSLGIKGLSIGDGQEIAEIASLSVADASIRNFPVYIFDPP